MNDDLCLNCGGENIEPATGVDLHLIYSWESRTSHGSGPVEMWLCRDCGFLKLAVPAHVLEEEAEARAKAEGR
jgi:hypothetical protein